MCQVALAFILLSSAGLLLASLQRVLAVAPGFQPDHLMTARVSLPEARYGSMASRRNFLARLEAELQAQPGVSAVGFTSNLPMADSAYITS